MNKLDKDVANVLAHGYNPFKELKWKETPTNESGVYILVNTENKTIYIGSSIDVARRIKQQKCKMEFDGIYICPVISEDILRIFEAYCINQARCYTEYRILNTINCVTFPAAQSVNRLSLGISE